jgi:hypothetical protein
VRGALSNQRPYRDTSEFFWRTIFDPPVSPHRDRAECCVAVTVERLWNCSHRTFLNGVFGQKKSHLEQTNFRLRQTKFCFRRTKFRLRQTKFRRRKKHFVRLQTTPFLADKMSSATDKTVSVTNEVLFCMNEISFLKNECSFLADKISFAEKNFRVARMKYSLLKRDFIQEKRPGKSPDETMFSSNAIYWARMEPFPA